MKAVILEKNKMRVEEVEPTLEKWYDLIGCDLVDITMRAIGEKYYPIVCDDEGLFKQSNYVNAVGAAGRSILVGTLIIYNDGEDGELAELTDDDVENIRSHFSCGALIYTD